LYKLIIFIDSPLSYYTCFWPCSALLSATLIVALQYRGVLRMCKGGRGSGGQSPSGVQGQMPGRRSRASGV